MKRGGPIQRKTGLQRGAPLRRTEFRPATDRPAIARQTPLRQVSAKRSRQNRERRAVIDSLWPERPQCARPACPRLADDVHEPLTRARGGSITDPDNLVPLCRPCHDEITFTPESELQWAYDLGLLRHSYGDN